MNQSNIQDVMWIDEAAKDVFTLYYHVVFSIKANKRQILWTRFPAYFVKPAVGLPIENVETFYVIIAMTNGFRAQREAAWRRLAKSEYCKVMFFDDAKDEEPGALW